MGAMKAAVWHGEPELVVQQWRKPEISDGQILVKIAYAGICASDIHIINGGLPRGTVKPPRVIGHECSGTVEAIGRNVQEIKVGDRVTGNPVGPCGACYFCHNKMEHFCEHPFSIIRGPGEGVFAEYIVFEEKQITRIPDGISLKHAALSEPLSVAVHCVEQANIQIGDVCVIIGAGVIGQLIATLAKKRGCSKVIVSDPNAKRRARADELGADVTVDPIQQDLKACIMDMTQGRGADVCVEAVGSPQLIEKCPELVRFGGTVLLVGWPPREAKVLFNPFLIYRYEVQIKGSQLSPYCFDKAVRMLDTIDPEKYISHVFGLDDINEAFKVQESGKGMRILIQM